MIRWHKHSSLFRKIISAIIRLGWKWLSGTNTLAYFGRLSQQLLDKAENDCEEQTLLFYQIVWAIIRLSSKWLWEINAPAYFVRSHHWLLNQAENDYKAQAF
jgi:hypothetical protein